MSSLDLELLGPCISADVSDQRYGISTLLLCHNAVARSLWPDLHVPLSPFSI